MGWHEDFFTKQTKSVLRMTKATCHQQSLKNTRSFWNLTVSFCAKQGIEHLIQEFVAAACYKSKIAELIYKIQIINKSQLWNSCTVEMLCWCDFSYHYSFFHTVYTGHGYFGRFWEISSYISLMVNGYYIHFYKNKYIQ